MSNGKGDKNNRIKNWHKYWNNFDNIDFSIKNTYCAGCKRLWEKDEPQFEDFDSKLLFCKKCAKNNGVIPF